MSKKLTHQEYLEKLREKNIEVIPIEEYIDMKTRILHQCVCGNTWEVTPGNVLSGKKCRKCQARAISLQCTKPLSEYLKDLKERNPYLIYISGYVNATTKCMHKCVECGEEVKIDPSHALIGNGCKKCAHKRIADKQRKTHRQFMEEVVPVLNHNIEVTGYYIDAKTPIDCICKSCGKPLQKSPESLLKGEGCQKCSAKEMGKRKTKTTEQFKEELYEINPLIEVISDYTGTKNQVKCKCLVNFSHPDWWAYPSNLLRGHGCNECSKVVGGQKKKQTSLEKHLKIIPKYNLELVGKYNGTFEDTDYKCLICGTVFPCDPHHISTGHTGCPICNSYSSGERIIYQFLLKRDILFYKEKIFPDLFGEWDYLRYDFYLPDYNLLLEFHGLQHEKPMEGYFGGQLAFEKRKKYDAKKEDYAKREGYNFLVIWYYDIDNIEQILTDYLHLNSESVETVMES